MKVIFLDVDGVLNSEEYVKKAIESGINGIESEIDIETVKLLKYIIIETGANIVLTSSWRYTKNGGDLVKLLNKYEIYPDLAPFINNVRGLEIKKWLQNSGNIEDYVIVDDEVFESFDDILLEKLIKISNGNGISYGEGLQKNDAEIIIKRLNPQKKLTLLK